MLNLIRGHLATMQSVRASTKRSHNHQSHKAACTHRQATRVFDEDILCSHCHQTGSMGWVYRCTQDTDGRVPVSDSGLTESEELQLVDTAKRYGWLLPGLHPSFTEQEFRAENEDGDITNLKPWMIKAVAAGEYTESQLEKLIAQRMQARQVIQAEEISLAMIGDSKSTDSTRKDKKKQSGAGNKADTPNTGLDGQESKASKDYIEIYANNDIAEQLLETYRKASQCDYKCCPACRPIMRDRAWTAIDSLFDSQNPAMYPTDVDVRPLASGKVILGINCPADDCESSVSSSSSISSVSYDAFEPDLSVSRRHSFTNLNNVRTLYSDFVVNPIARSKSTNSYSSPSSRRSSSSSSYEIDITNIVEDERMAALSVARPESRIGNFWMPDDINHRNGPSLHAELLHHMSSESIDSILATAGSRSESTVPQSEINGELHVGEGVAVTEEAVDLGMADIITQA